MSRRFVSVLVGTCAAIAGLLGRSGGAENPPPAAPAAALPLHERVDFLVESANLRHLAPIVDDAGFLRRLYLDLIGRIPSVAEARAFLDDPAPPVARRAALIDRLLAMPEHARWLATWFDLTWMERRGETHIKAAEWSEYLFQRFLANRPLHEIVREILSADGDGELRPAARFYLEREVEVHRLTRDIGRLVFGRDLQCAQCHDHPLIDDYKQSEYQGLHAFLNRTHLFLDKDKKAFIAEKADGEVTYSSVFVPKTTHVARPRLPGGRPLDEPSFEKGQEYEVAPADGVRAVPKFSRRKLLAQAATDGTNDAFNRNLANRLWAFLFGRGVVEPPDLHHGANPPSDPRLLRLLADELRAMEFDARAFLRELALTRAYQRASVLALPEAPPPPWAEESAKLLAALESDSERLAAEAAAARQAAAKAFEELDALRTAERDATTSAEAAGAELAKAEREARAVAERLSAEKSALAAKERAARLFAQAAESTENAGKELGGDAVLADVAGRLVSRSAEARAEEAALRQSIQAGETDISAAQAIVAEARARAGAAGAERTAAHDRLVAALENSQALARAADVAEDAALAERGKVNGAALLVEWQRAVSGSPEDVASARSRLEERWIERFGAAALKPLSPEQLAWSLMQAAGIVERERAFAAAALEKESPPDLSPQERARRLEKAVRDKLSGNAAPFVALFGGAPGEPPQEYQATVAQALFLRNGSALLGWFQPGSGSISDRLDALADPQSLAEELYLALLTRRPDDGEKAEVRAALAQLEDPAKLDPQGREARRVVIRDLVWALVTSAEFRFNH